MHTAWLPVRRSREAACASQVCACRLDEGVERGCILLDHVQQHNLHLATLEKYEFRSATVPLCCPTP